MEIVIRSAAPSEAYAINTLVADSRAARYYDETTGLDNAWAARLRMDLLSPEGLAECRYDIVQAAKDPRYRLYAVAADTAIRGVVYAERLTDVQEIRRLSVADGYRGQGIGRHLLAAYSDWANQTMYHTVDVAPDNYRAVGMYTRRGYRFNTRVTTTWPDGVTTMRMQKAKERV